MSSKSSSSSSIQFGVPVAVIANLFRSYLSTASLEFPAFAPFFSSSSAYHRLPFFSTLVCLSHTSKVQPGITIRLFTLSLRSGPVQLELVPAPITLAAEFSKVLDVPHSFPLPPLGTTNSFLASPNVPTDLQQFSSKRTAQAPVILASVFTFSKYLSQPCFKQKALN